MMLFLFSGLRNLLLWVIAVSLTVYVVDSFLFGSYTESLETLSDENG